MIYDADTWIGHWPFRSLPRTRAVDLLRQMDSHGIEKALVGNLQGLLYKDAHEANHELVKEIRRRRDRLVPCAVVNPAYYGWQHDLRQCREEFDMPVVRAVPDYHGYSLTDPCAEALVAEAQSLNMKVAFCGRIVDPRGRHRLDPGRETNETELEGLIKKFPTAAFLMLNFRRIIGAAPSGAPACCCDITRFVGRNGLRLAEEIKRHGAGHFVFGSTMLLRCGRPAVLALGKCRLTKRERDGIQYRNLLRIVPEMR